MQSGLADPREAWATKAAQKATAVAKLRARHPHLIPARGDGLTVAAKNMRIELRAAFPGIKFSIKSRRFSGGDAIDVRWTDGPTTTQVDAIIKRYAAGRFDGMDDSYTYFDSAWGEAFGDAKYVQCARDYSAAAVRACARTMLARLHIDPTEQRLDDIAAKYGTGKLWGERIDDSGRPTLEILSLELSRRTWAIDKTPGAKRGEQDHIEVAA